MHVVAWLIAGGLVGWVAGLIMKRHDGVLLNVVSGIVGALLGGWLLAPLLGVGTIDQGTFTLTSLLVSLAGTVVLLATVNIGRRGRMR